jgi:transcription elongation factor B subunit 1
MSTSQQQQSTSSTEEEELVTLVSSDGMTFKLKKQVAFGSGTIKSMLSGEGYFAEELSNTITFSNIRQVIYIIIIISLLMTFIRGEILKKVCEYLEYKYTYQTSGYPSPDFNVDVEHALELLVAADYLDV